MGRAVYNHPRATHAQTIPVLCQEVLQTQDPARLVELARLLRWHGDKLRGQRATPPRKALRGMAYAGVAACRSRLSKQGWRLPLLPWGGMGPQVFALDEDRYWRLYAAINRMWDTPDLLQARLLDGLAAVVERYECQQEGSMRTPRPSSRVQIYKVADVAVERVVAHALHQRCNIVCCPKFWARIVAAAGNAPTAPTLDLRGIQAYPSRFLLEDTVLFLPQ